MHIPNFFQQWNNQFDVAVVYHIKSLGWFGKNAIKDIKNTLRLKVIEIINIILMIVFNLPIEDLIVLWKASLSAEVQQIEHSLSDCLLSLLQREDTNMLKSLPISTGFRSQ